jgi:hypothetical protein
MERRWTTLSEALALSLGYQTNPPPNAATEPDVTYPYWYDPNITPKSPLDRGNLRLDEFAPFTDNNGDGIFQPPNDQRQGLEIPLALNVLDVFTAYPMDNRNSNAANPTFTVIQPSLTTPTRGKLNVNTASDATLRTLSLLSPPPTDDLAGNPGWWWRPVGPALPPINGDPNSPTNPQLWPTDVVSTISAYRDKRFHSTPFPYQAVSQNNTQLKFVDFSEQGVNQGVNPDASEDQFAGRAFSTHVGLDQQTGQPATSAMHERPGFASVGELAIVRFLDQGDTTTKAWPSNMDWLGHDTLSVPAAAGAPAPVPGNSGRVGLDSVLYPDTTPGAPPNSKAPDRVANEYKEQLELLNGVLGNVSNRSDYFIVWFQLQGYQKSDVEGLGPNDPMVPSVNRRFVMVVDRSKVYKKGQKADILLFKEVPVDPQPR